MEAKITNIEMSSEQPIYYDFTFEATFAKTSENRRIILLVKPIKSYTTIPYTCEVQWCKSTDKH